MGRIKPVICWQSVYLSYLFLGAIGLLASVPLASPVRAQEDLAVEVEETTVEAPAEAAAEEPAPPDGLNKSLNTVSHALDTVWVLIAGFLVMWMQAGFALVETGLTRA